jgi:hypothetical protein
VEGGLVVDSTGNLNIYQGGAWKLVCNKTDQGCGTGSGSALSAISAATVGNTINSGDNAQVWNWSVSTADKSAFTFGENLASTATGTPAILAVQTLATSTATPLYVKNYGDADSFRIDDVSGDTSPFIINASGNVGIGLTDPGSFKLNVNGNTNITGNLTLTALGTADNNTLLCRNSSNQIAGCQGSLSGTNTGDQNIFQTIATSSGTSPVADTTTDTLTLTAGANITITGNSATDTITIAAADQYQGTVTSVGLALPTNEFSITNSPVTGSGTLTGSWKNQNANVIFAGPSTGAAAAPTFRTLVDNDIPDSITITNLSGTNTGDVTLAGSLDYLTIAGQVITRNAIDLATDVTGTLADGNIPASITRDTEWDTAAEINAATTDADFSLTTHNHTLDSLSNVTITANSDGEILRWNGVAWVNNTLAEAGIQAAGNYLTTATAFGGDVSGTYNNIVVTDDSHAHTAATLPATISYLGASIDLGSEVTGTLPVGNGGTGATTFTQYGVLYGDNANAIKVTAAGTTGQCLIGNTGAAPSWGACSSGSVTSVGLALPTNEFTITNSPVTTTGTLTGSWKNQNANVIFAGPSTGAAAAPTFRTLVDNDIPDSITITNLSGTNTGDVTLAGSLDYLTIAGQVITRNAIDLATDVTGVLPLANGGTSKNLTASNGAIVYSDADSFELSGVGTSGQALVSGGAGAPTWYAPTAGSILFAGTSGVLSQDNANFYYDATGHNLAIGTNTITSKLNVTGATTGSGATAIAGIYSNLTLTNSTGSGYQFGNRTVVTVNGGTAGTEVGTIIRMTDDTALANTVRGLEVQAWSGSNPNGINTGIATFGKTFGIQATTDSKGAGVLEPAAIYADLDNGTATTVGNAIRAFTDNATSANRAYWV